MRTPAEATPEQLTDSINTTATVPTTTTDGATNREGSTAAAPFPDAEPVLSEAEALRMENDRLRRELAAALDDKERAREIVKTIDAADHLYETAKAEAKKHKEERDGAKASLRALLAGEVNVKIDFDKKDDGAATPGQPAKVPLSERKALRFVHATYAVSQFALTRDAISKLDLSPLRPLAPEIDKRKIPALHAGPLLFAPLAQEFLEDGSGYFDAWPLIDAESWAVNYAKEFGEAVADLSDAEAPDVAKKRQAGGDLCGIMVKVNGQRRKRFVVGPDRECARFLYGMSGGAVEKDAAVAKLLPEGIAPEKTAEVIAFPASQLADRIEARLREYEPIKSTGYHEGAVGALAGDLRVDETEIANAARADSFRFEVRAESLNGRDVEVVRLLVDSDRKAAASAGQEPEVLGGDATAAGAQA